MPLYTFSCSCGREVEVFRRIHHRDSPEQCDICGKPMQRVLEAPQVAPDIAPYQSMATGEWITSRSQHREHLRRNHLIEVGNEKIDPPKPKMPDAAARKRTIAEVVASRR